MTLQLSIRLQSAVSVSSKFYLWLVQESGSYKSKKGNMDRSEYELKITKVLSRCQSECVDKI